MQFLKNIKAKKKLKQMNESLTQVFLAKDLDDFHKALEHAHKIHHQAENSLDDEFLYPENDEEKSIFSKNVWLNIDTLNFLEKYSTNVISDSLIFSIGSFYVHSDKSIKLLFANFVLDGLIMAKAHYKDNWKEYMSRYFEIQNNISSFVENNISVDVLSTKTNHPFNYQYPSYYLFTSFQEESVDDTIKVTHYDRALVKLAILNKNNEDKAFNYIQKAIELYGVAVVINGEEKFFTSPLNKVIYENDKDRLMDYSFVSNLINKYKNQNIEDLLI